MRPPSPPAPGAQPQLGVVPSAAPRLACNRKHSWNQALGHQDPRVGGETREHWRSVLPQNHVSPQCVFPQGVSFLRACSSHWGCPPQRGRVPLKACPPTGACPPQGVSSLRGVSSPPEACPLLRGVFSGAFLPQDPVPSSLRVCQPPEGHVLPQCVSSFQRCALPQSFSNFRVCPPSGCVLFRVCPPLRVCPLYGCILPQGCVLSSGVCSLLRDMSSCSLPEGPLLLAGPCSPFRSLFSFQEYSIFPSTKGAPLPKDPCAHLSRSSGVPLGSFIASCQQDQTHTEATVSVSLCNQGPTEDRWVEGVGVSVLSMPSLSLPDSFVRRTGNPYRGPPGPSLLASGTALASGLLALDPWQ